MTYTELCTAVEGYLESTFTTTQLALFTKQAETRIYNMVQLPSMRKLATLVTVNGTRYVDCPTDFLAVVSLAAIHPSTGAYTFLLNKDPNFIREAYPVPATTGSPAYYAIYGPPSGVAKELTFLLGPTPDAVYSLELQYVHYPESIVTAVNTWLGDNYDPALFYGTLVEAYTFLKGEPDILKQYDNKFGEAMMQLKRLGDGMQRQDSYRSGQARVPVK